MSDFKIYIYLYNFDSFLILNKKKINESLVER